EQLHADADPEERLALGDGLAQQRRQPARLDLVHRGAEGTIAREHQGVRPPQGGRVAAELDLGADLAEALRHAAEVADAVVDDRDHRLPLVEGTPVTPGSHATAVRSARAVALNSVSAMWWLLRPRSTSRCRLKRPWSTSAQKKSSKSSVGMS